MGASRDFDGVDDWINAGSGSSIDDLHSGFTAAFWVRLDGFSSNGSSIVYDKAGQKQLFVQNSDSQQNKLYFLAEYDGSTNLNRRSNVDFIETSTWMHLIATWTGSNLASSVHLYRDLTEASGYTNEVDGDGSLVSDASGNLRLGNDIPFGQIFDLDGQLAHFAIWNRVLNEGERAEVYHKDPLALPSGLRIYLPLYGVESPEPDKSGNGNDGSLTGPTVSFLGPPI